MQRRAERDLCSSLQLCEGLSASGRGFGGWGGGSSLGFLETRRRCSYSQPKLVFARGASANNPGHTLSHVAPRQHPSATSQ